MERLIEWFTRNTVAANLLMWLIVVWGVATVPFLEKEVFPELPINVINVTVPYPGAAPAEVEDGICRRIEDEVRGIPGVEKVTSLANEGMAVVSIEVVQGMDLRETLDDVKNRVNAIPNLPEEAEKPIIGQVVVTRQVISLAVAGEADERTLKEMAYRVRDDLTALEGITKVEVVGARPYEISIEVAEESLRRYGIGFDAVAAAVRRFSVDLPGGSVETRGGEIRLRADGQAYRGIEFEKIPLITRPDGTRLLLGDVARVVDGFADTDQATRIDGKPAVLVQVYRVGDQDVLEITRKVEHYLEDVRPRLPRGLELTVWRDYSEMLRSRLLLLTNSAIYGLMLVFAVLALFLRFRLAFWVSLGIPVSFLGAILMMPILGVTLNMISLFAFIVVLGIVVDDAIVVGESVYGELRAGRGGLQAAIAGSRKVAVPVVFAVLTTIAAFAPMLDVEGNAREIWAQVPLIVIPCLVFSLIESKLILPAHLSHERAFGDEPQAHGIRRLFVPLGRLWRRIQYPFAEGLQLWIQKVYRPSLEWCLRWRYPTASAFVALLALTAAWVFSGRLPWIFFPAVESNNVVAMVTMPLGTPVDVTAAAVRRLEEAAERVRDEIDRSGVNKTSVFRHVLASIGDQPYRAEQRKNIGQAAEHQSGSHLGEVNVLLSKSEDRVTSAEEVLRRWRRYAGTIPDAVELSFTYSIVSTGEDINIQLAAPDLEMLKRVAEEVKAYLARFPGVEDISDTFRAGKQELEIAVRPEAETLGLSLLDVARQVRQGFHGEEAQRIQRERDDVKVMVRYPEQERRSIGYLEDMRIRTPAGDEVPFSYAARASYGRGDASIKRTDGARTVNVTAAVDERVTTANQVLARFREELQGELQRSHPGLRISFEGDTKEQARSLNSLLRGFVVALFVIYMLMAVPFRSYLQPLIVMSVIPFGLVGATWGHVFMGYDLSIMSMLGLVALSGVVVNDSLVLVDHVNRRRRAGEPLTQAVRNAGMARFRPILLTSLTTCAGVTPLMLERSLQARFMIPMAVSLAFGVLFATFITLVLVPMIYVILEDLRRAAAWLLGRPRDPTPTATG